MSETKKDERCNVNEKRKYSIIDWSAYNEAPDNRGDITFLMSDEPLRRGTRKNSGPDVEAIVTFKPVFRPPYRRAKGFTRGILKLTSLSHLDAPNFVQVSHRYPTVKIRSFDLLKPGSITIAADATEAEVYSARARKCREHGWNGCRAWRKLYRDADPNIGLTHRHTTTTDSQGDESQVDDLVNRVEAKIDGLYLD